MMNPYKKNIYINVKCVFNSVFHADSKYIISFNIGLFVKAWYEGAEIEKNAFFYPMLIVIIMYICI